MLKVLNLGLRARPFSSTTIRTFLSQAYHCNEVWANRLQSPLLQKVNLDVFYHELEQRFQKTRQISAVDVDIFANAVKDDLFIDELMDLVHKLRLSAATENTLESTPHAVIRTLLNYNKTEELLRAVDDRLNYGLFLDDHITNILLDSFWKSKNFAAGVLIASQSMLQEDLKHPLTNAFTLLHCYNYLLKPEGWIEPQIAEEPEEEVKVRVAYLRNPYDDEHFDLKEPTKIIRKTLAKVAKAEDPLNASFRVLGLALYGKSEKLAEELKKSKELIKEIIDLVPDEIRKDFPEIQLKSEDVSSLLIKLVEEQSAITSEKDIANQIELYRKWDNNRLEALENQKKRVSIAERLTEIEKLQSSLREKEQKLWFFENEENIELKIQAHKPPYIERRLTKKQQAIEVEYVPPEVISRT